MKKIMIIRHAEKPEGKIHGVTSDGKKSKDSLTPRGWQRAGALVRYFNPVAGIRLPPGLTTPIAIFASHVEAGERSQRPRHTVEPLADALGVKINHRFGRDSETKLGRALAEVPGPALVCWHHENIPALVDMLAPSLAHPRIRPGRRFDVVWVLEQDPATLTWIFLQVPQLLLCGDSIDVIS